MATGTQPLTRDEFHERYHDCKPHYEYWFGEAIQKSKPTWLHALVQSILGEMFRRAGYKSGSELELRIDPNWEPVPDVVATLRGIETPYPTKPVEIVVEVLSAEDRAGKTLPKCRQYTEIGIEKVFVVDPEARDGWEWNAEAGHLERVQELRLTNGRVITLDDVWKELDRQLL